MTALNNMKAARENITAQRQTIQDARDVIVLAVGGAYLQTIAAKARVVAARAQLETVFAQFTQTQQNRESGVATQIDVNRADVQQKLQQLMAHRHTRKTICPRQENQPGKAYGASA